MILLCISILLFQCRKLLFNKIALLHYQNFLFHDNCPIHTTLIKIVPRYDLITTAIYYYYFMFDSCGWVRNKKNTEWLNNEYFLYRNYKLESIVLLTYHFICFLHWTVCNIGSVDLLSDNKCQQQKYKVHQACLNPIAWIP